MNQYRYKGFEIRQNGKNFDFRRYYPPAVHKGYPQEFVPAVRGAETFEEANARLDDAIAAQG